MFEKCDIEPKNKNLGMVAQEVFTEYVEGVLDRVKGHGEIIQKVEISEFEKCAFREAFHEINDVLMRLEWYLSDRETGSGSEKDEGFQYRRRK